MILKANAITLDEDYQHLDHAVVQAINYLNVITDLLVILQQSFLTVS
jgi:hypothetical protein